MSALFQEDIDIHDPVEVHWSPSTILAIFFAASLVSAVFFGLGYSFGGVGAGQHSLSFHSVAVSRRVAAPTVQPAKFTPATSSNQPSPTVNLSNNVNAHPAVAAPSAPPVATRPAAMATVAHAQPPVIEKKSMAAPVAPRGNATSTQTSSAHIMVQVGAIGDRKDAERLVAELREKGFHAGIYLAKHDRFLHVQIGPFKDIAQAQSKRHQVMASGFHAILKSTS